MNYVQGLWTRSASLRILIHFEENKSSFSHWQLHLCREWALEAWADALQWLQGRRDSRTKYSDRFSKFTQIFSCSCLLLLNVIFRSQVQAFDVTEVLSWLDILVGFVWGLVWFAFLEGGVPQIIPRVPTSVVACATRPRRIGAPALLCYSHGIHEGSPRPQGCCCSWPSVPGAARDWALSWEYSGKTGNVIVSRALGNEWGYCGQDPDFVGCIMQYSCT